MGIAHHKTYLSHILHLIQSKMELPHLGTHCSLPTCNRLDYLPFKCNNCAENFCENHWKSGQHNCSKSPVEHSSTFDNVAEKTTITTVKKKKPKQNPCKMPNCSGHNLVRMGCGECGLNFCVKHRFPDEHQCLRRHTSRLSRLLVVK